jgi:hypothetical protein
MKGKQKPCQYQSKKTTIDCIEFASQTEGRRYRELKFLQQVGEISGLELQPEYILVPAHRKCPNCPKPIITYPSSRKSNKCPVCKSPMKTIREMKYIADFRYFTKEGKEIIEDVKGSKTYRTDKFRHKEKVFEMVYPDKIITVWVPGVKR